jgi:hypothetical protein
MDELLVEGGTVEFSADSGWAWAGGWDGKITLSVSPHGMTSDGKAVALAEDLERLATRLTGKSYTADGFADVPGTVTSASVSVDHGTLSPRVAIDGSRAATAHTQGTFQLNCVPSLKAGCPPIPDPVPLKRGTWRVVECGQAAARADR